MRSASRATLIVTRNGGKTWSIMTVGTADTMYAVRFATPKIGWLVGTGGQVMQTKDAGRSWQRQTSATSSSLLCVASADKATRLGRRRGRHADRQRQQRRSLVGARRQRRLRPGRARVRELAKLVAAGTGGVAAATTDGGQHWARKASGTQAALRGLDFLNATHGWAAGDAGTLLRTTNGGAKWTAGVSGTGQDLRAVAVRRRRQRLGRGLRRHRAAQRGRRRVLGAQASGVRSTSPASASSAPPRAGPSAATPGVRTTPSSCTPRTAASPGPSS